MEAITTGKCATYGCGHAESAHTLGFLSEGTIHLYGKACAHHDSCLAYQPIIDISAFNTTDGKPPVELYEFQKKYLRGLPAKYLFAADTGVGKTVMALYHYDTHAYLQPLLILAPASKVQTGDWERELKEYFAGRLLPEYEIYSYEKFSRNSTIKQYKATGSRGVWHDWMLRHPGGYAMIVDEVHRAKNPQSGIGKAVFEVSKQAPFFVGLSATPLPNGWIDSANYYKIFGFSRGISEFKKKYCNIQTFKGFPEIVGYWHEGELQRLWNGIAKPLSKDEALDLPSLTTVPVSLPAGSEYMKVQKERLFGEKFLDNPSALMHALRQSVAAPKIAWLDDFLEGVSGHTLIFYNYKSERKVILDMLAKNHKGRKVIRQDGEFHEIPSKTQWDSLPPRTITLAQYQSGGTGVEITYSNTIVYFSPTYSYSSYEQSIGRVYRNGQKSKCTIYLLCAPATIERDIYAALRNKSDFQTAMWYQNNIEDIK